MPKAVITFGAWEPDKAQQGHWELIKAENVYPIVNGYAPVGSFEGITVALADWTGGGAFIGANGSARLLGGSSAGLFVYSGTAWGSAFAVTAGRWRFSQNRQLVVGVHGGAPVAYDLTAATGGLLGGSPPAATYTATVGDFTFLAGDPANVRTVYWSGFGNPEIWTPGVNSAGNLPLPDGGPITGLSGGEYGLVFQRQAIHRFQFVGEPDVWQRDKISSEIGCIAPGSVVSAGRLVFFLSERGFMKCDGVEVTPIGSEKVDKAFIRTFARSALVNMYAATDPRHYLVVWAMPGNPGQAYVYNWYLDRWTTISLPMKGVVTAFTSNIAMDAADAVYPGGADAIILPMDSPLFQGGEPRIFYVTAAGVLGTLTGANMAAGVTTAANELVPGRYCRPHMARPVTDATAGVSLAIDQRRVLGTAGVLSPRTEMRGSGDMPVRANGRYFLFDMSIAAGQSWSYLQGLEVVFGDGGTR